MAKTYTVEQFKKYLLKQDSMGDILYNLNEANIDKANEAEDVEDDGEYHSETASDRATGNVGWNKM